MYRIICSSSCLALTEAGAHARAATLHKMLKKHDGLQDRHIHRDGAYRPLEPIALRWTPVSSPTFLRSFTTRPRSYQLEKPKNKTDLRSESTESGVREKEIMCTLGRGRRKKTKRHETANP